MPKKAKLVNKKGMRTDGRKLDEIRPLKLEVGVVHNADGSAYIEQGKNKILAALYGPREVHPRHLALPDRGILRCRYHMAPFSVDERKSPAPSRRDVEISKVIRGALEPAIFLERFPRTSIDLFIEVLQADGGTRSASITAGCVALALALKKMMDEKIIGQMPLKFLVSGISVGIVEGEVLLDLDYNEDSKAEIDMNVVETEKGQLVELQATAEKNPFSRKELSTLLSLAHKGIKEITQVQKDVLKKKSLLFMAYR